MRASTSAPRLLPEGAYPASIDEAGRDRVDAHMRAELHTIPTEPGEYLDREGQTWSLDDAGGWTDPEGEHRGPEHTPALVFTGLHKEG